MANLTFEEYKRGHEHIIEMSILLEMFGNVVDPNAIMEKSQARQRIDEETGYHLIKWLRENGFPPVLVEAEHVEATAANPTERLRLTVRRDGEAGDPAPGAE